MDPPRKGGALVVEFAQIAACSASATSISDVMPTALLRAERSSHEPLNRAPVAGHGNGFLDGRILGGSALRKLSKYPAAVRSAN